MSWPGRSVGHCSTDRAGGRFFIGESRALCGAFGGAAFLGRRSTFAAACLAECFPERGACRCAARESQRRRRARKDLAALASHGERYDSVPSNWFSLRCLRRGQVCPPPAFVRTSASFARCRRHPSRRRQADDGFGSLLALPALDTRYSLPIHLE
ncbi:hypothetical protein HPB47_008052 [Ixodes persulcatus]|uniref:Uncharacterized protein n=1 Tax=Ixodes persulcatus TaxID=34615 RepID=A0AC60P5S3_IXOPE|nr:hypothetical protein HPB47_008052 [Ixodes persulcatus]